MIDKRIENLLDRFDQEWQFSAIPPSIADFLQEAIGLGFDEHEIREELVRIDAEYRWRRREPARLMPLVPNKDGSCPEVSDYCDALKLSGDVSWLDAEIEMLRQKFPEVSRIDHPAHVSTIIIHAKHPADQRTHTPADFALPDANERYLPDRHLGSGAFGDVWLMRDRVLDRGVAIKTLRTDNLSPAVVARLIYESRMAATVKHAHIPTIYDVFASAKGVHFVMEYIEGTPFDVWVKGRPLVDRLRVIVDVADAVHSAHVAGLIHCDIKPGNVLIDAKGSGWLIDFGLAIHEQEQAKLKNVMFGTPAFLSPEQVRCESHRIDGRTDVWALGVMLYWAMTDRLPFQGASQAELFEEIEFRHAKPLRQINEDVPIEIETICLRCLKQNPPDRFATAGDFAEGIRAVLSPHAVAASPPRQRVLPVERDSIVGRESIIEEVVQLFTTQRSRLITLTGAGGIGKTRLATAVAQRLQDSFAGGIFWVDVSSARTISDLCQSIRTSTGLPAPAGNESSQLLGESLRLLGPVLLILDNLEQALAAVPETIGPWMQQPSELRILATSQRRLRLRQEHVIPLPPLSLPTDEGTGLASVSSRSKTFSSEAMQLLVDRANEAGCPLDDSPETWQAAADICRRLDGLPLAIELAAARLPVLGIQGVARKLSRSFDFLKSPCEDTPLRQQTLNAAINWSLELLSKHEQDSLQLIAEWPAAMPTELCEQLIELGVGNQFDAIDILQELQDRSFLRSRHDDGVVWLEVPGSVHAFLKQGQYFDSSESSREYHEIAVEFWKQQRRFGLRSAFAEAACENLWYVSESTDPKRDSDFVITAAILADSFAVNRVSAKRRVERLLGLEKRVTSASPALYLSIADAFKSAAEYASAVEFVNRAIERCDGEPESCDGEGLRIECLRCRAETWYEAGDYELAAQDADNSIGRCGAAGEHEGLLQVLAVKGHIAWRTGNLDEAIRWFDMALRQPTVRTDPAVIGELIRDKGNALLLQGRPEKALPYFIEAEQWAEKSRDLKAMYSAKLSRAAVLSESGSYTDAIELYTAAEKICRRLGDSRGVAKVMTNHALALIDRGEPAGSLSLLDEAVCLNRRCGHQAGICISLSAYGAAYLALGRPREALACLDECVEKIAFVAGSWHEAVIRRDRGAVLLALPDKHEEAESMLEQSLAILKSLHGEQSPDAFLVYLHLSTVPPGLADGAESDANRQRALELAEYNRLDRHHPRKRIADGVLELEKLGVLLPKKAGNAPPPK
jgi:predicted ATPase/predicted Ser/Thr protein kinase